MKNKTKTYLLLVTVLGIWGTIGYKIITGMSTDGIAEIQQENVDMFFNPKANTEIDTFSIQTLERDPFLGTLTRPKRRSKNSSVKPKKEVVEKAIPIIYNGLVKRQNTSDQVFVVQINNNQFLLKKGQIADSVKLVKGNDKEIIIRYQNKNETIKRQ